MPWKPYWRASATAVVTNVLRRVRELDVVVHTALADDDCVTFPTENDSTGRAHGLPAVNTLAN